MKKPLNLILIIILAISSCGKKTEKINDYTKYFNPNHFEGKYQPKVSILGTFHFANQVEHDYMDKYEVNGLNEQKQKELKILRDKLAEFKPTKILIERNRINSDSSINFQYKQYLKSDSIPQINDEVYLIGFPLAKKLNLEKIHCSDANAEWFGADLDWKNFDEDTYLKSRNQYKKSYRYQYNEVYKIQDSLRSILNLVDYFNLSNSPKLQIYNHQIYLTETALSGAGDNYIGADAVARWYRRNLRIFSNVLDIANFEQEERILLIYGESHIWTLKQFFEDSPDFNYIEINNFLKN